MHKSFSWTSQILGYTLAVYWMALFAGTHSPTPPHPNLGHFDKVMHFSGYLGLTLLLASWRLVHHRLSWGILASTLAIVISFGAADEITQIPVGRDCEFLDWVADASGAAVGLAIAAALKYRRYLGSAISKPSEPAAPTVQDP